MIYSNFISTVELRIWLTKKKGENLLIRFRIEVLLLAKGQTLKWRRADWYGAVLSMNTFPHSNEFGFMGWVQGEEKQ